MSKSPGKSPKEPDRIERLRERVGALEKERDEAQQALDRASADREKQVQRVEEARRVVAEADQSYAKALASSYREEEGEPALADAKSALEDARRQLADAESEVARLAEAADMLRADLRKAEKRLAEGATESKKEAAEELLTEVRVAWGPVKGLLGDIRAITSVPHGDNPSASRFAEAASERFERTVLEGKPPAAAPSLPGPTPGRGALGSLLALLGGAGLIAGAFLEWLRPFEAAGVDLEIRAFYQEAFFEGTKANRPSAGLAVILVGVLAVGGATFRRSWLAGLAGVLGVAAFALYAATVAGTEELSFPSSMGVGPWLVLVGGILVMASAWFFAARPGAGPPEGGGSGGAARRRSWWRSRGSGEAGGSSAGGTGGNPGGKHNPGGNEGGGEAHEARALERARRARVARVVAILAILIAFIVVVTQNSQPVEFRVLGATFHPRLIWVVVVSAVVGMIFGYLIGRPRRRAGR